VPDTALAGPSAAPSGRLKPVIDRSFRPEEAAEAHRYAETEHKKGNIVLAAAD